MPSAPVQTIVQQIRDARAGLERLSDLDRQLRAEHDAAGRARDRLLSLLEPVNVLVANMCATVDAKAATFAKEYAPSIARTFSGGFTLQRDGAYTEEKPALWDGPRRDLNFRDLCGLVPEVMKARLEAILRTAEYEAGPAMSDRPAAIAEAHARIREVEDHHADLVDAAAALDPPIVLTLLEAVQRRRAVEAAQRQRDEGAAEARRRQEELVNQSRAARPRIGESAYLAEGRRGPFGFA